MAAASAAELRNNVLLHKYDTATVSVTVTSQVVQRPADQIERCVSKHICWAYALLYKLM